MSPRILQEQKETTEPPSKVVSKNASIKTLIPDINGGGKRSVVGYHKPEGISVREVKKMEQPLMS